MGSLEENIVSAFADVPKPNGSRSIAPHECPECDEIEKQFSPYTFTNLPAKVIDYHKDSLSLFSSEALHHYLPAYLLRALQRPEGDVLEYTIFFLTPSHKRIAEDTAYFEERFSVFNTVQRAVISSFFGEVEKKKLWEGFEGEFERAEELWGHET